MAGAAKGEFDAMVDQAIAVRALAGAHFIEQRHRSFFQQAGADAVLLVRMSGFTTETSVGLSSGVVVPAGSNMYVGWYEPGVVTDSYQAATIYTTLFDVRTARPVWTYNPPDYNPATLQQNAPAYANGVAGMLKSSGLVAGL